jgi:hypothetical protein
MADRQHWIAKLPEEHPGCGMDASRQGVREGPGELAGPIKTPKLRDLHAHEL